MLIMSPRAAAEPFLWLGFWNWYRREYSKL